MPISRMKAKVNAMLEQIPGNLPELRKALEVARDTAKDTSALSMAVSDAMRDHGIPGWMKKCWDIWEGQDR